LGVLIPVLVYFIIWIGSLACVFHWHRRTRQLLEESRRRRAHQKPQAPPNPALRGETGGPSETVGELEGSGQPVELEAREREESNEPNEPEEGEVTQMFYGDRKRTSGYPASYARPSQQRRSERQSSELRSDDIESSKLRSKPGPSEPRCSERRSNDLISSEPQQIKPGYGKLQRNMRRPSDLRSSDIRSHKPQPSQLKAEPESIHYKTGSTYGGLGQGRWEFFGGFRRWLGARAWFQRGKSGDRDHY
jgi:hypothetical protein